MEPNIPTEFSFSGRKSVPFCDFNVSDYGKESMGILPPDFGKDSSDLMNFSHRESLGILQINALSDSLSFRRESLGILNLQDLGRPSLDCGKESLGILHLKSPDVKFGDEDKKAPDILLSTVGENSTESFNILDMAFLQPTTFRKSSTLSSISNNPSFHSGSLEGPSRIYSVKSTKSDTDNFTNFSYFDSMVSSSIHSPLNKARIFSPSESNIRLRIQSMPVNLQDNFSPLHKDFASGVSVEKKIWSADRTRRFRPLEISFQESIDFRDGDPSIEFHDSVFIEGHIFAEKLADGSILNESFIGEVGTLDSTPQPNWPEDVSYLESKDKECQICDTESVFKTVDKMLPGPVTDIINAKLKTSKTDSTSSNDNEEKANKSQKNNSKLSQNGEKNVSKLLLNLSDIQHEPKGMSNDPKDILENLSQLLNSRNHSEKEKSKGKNLINSLADILCESKPNSTDQLDDSGHSSTNEQVVDSPNKENHFCSEVLDLRIKSTEEETSRTKSCGDVALDLSVKSKRIESLKDKRLSQSLGSASPKLKFGPQTEKNSSLDLNKNKTNNSSATSNDSRNISNLTRPQISGKLRQKSSNLKKGPMKAVVPVGDMKKKCNTSGTPEKNENVISTLQSKRTSTPINEPKLKPMAASTPTIQAAKDISRLSKNPRSSMESPLAKSKKINSSNNFTRERTSSFSSVVKASNSARELKRPDERVRSNSVDRKSVIRPSFGKTIQNSSVPYQQKLENKPAFENIRKLREIRHLPLSKSNNLESKSTETRMVTPNKLKHIGSSECSLKSGSSSSSQVKNKTEGHCGKRNSVSESVRSKENPGKVRRNSITTVTGMMSSLAKIRQNMRDSPYFPLKKEDSLDNDSAVLSENRRLGRSNSQPQLKKKTGKENVEI